MSAAGGDNKDVSILSLDDGGPGSYSQLVVIKEYMGRIALDTGENEDDVYPADYFDLMGGVGFGGLIVLMLGHLRMNVEEAMNALVNIGDAVFPEGFNGELDRELNAERLKESVEDMLQGRSIPLDAKMHDKRRPAMRCKVAIYATTAADITHSRAFRTYPAPGSNLNPTIAEAICATISNPSFFLPVKIGPRLRQQSFVGGALGASNPTRELLKEAGTLFGKDRRVAQIISLGSGLGRLLSLDASDGPTEVDLLLKDMAVNCETVANELASRLVNVNAYLRLNVDRGMDRGYMTDWTGLGAIEGHTSAYLETPIITQAVEASIQRLRERIGTVTLDQLNQSSNIKATARQVPEVSPYYVARKKESDLMVLHLISTPHSRRRVLPITGVGGCGKTQLVASFIQDHPSLYTHIVFVDASSTSSIKADLQTWAQSLGGGHERDVWEDALRLLGSSPSGERSALVLDNADDPNLDLVPFLPKNKNLAIIITSRNRNLGYLSTTYHLELGEMEEDEALLTLVQAARRRPLLPPEEMASAQTLMQELGNLAVALVQVGTYCYELSSTIQGVPQPYTFTQYLSLFHSHRAELLKQTGPSSLDSYQRGVYTTLDLSYNAIPRIARGVFHVLSFFHHTSFPVAALATAAEQGFKDQKSYLPRPEGHAKVISDLTDLLLVDGKWSELHIQEVIRTLRSFSLISATSMDDRVFLQIHPLVQTWSRDMLDAHGLYLAMAMQVVTVCASKGVLNRYLLTHVTELLEQYADSSLHVNDMMVAGQVHVERGSYRKAISLFTSALQILKNSVLRSENDVFLVISWLASAYWKQGRWNEAETLQQEVLEQRRRLLGMEHPDTIRAAANLAATYRRQGRWSEAETLEQEVLEQRRRLLGMEHPHAITAAANLAATYRQQGRWNEAETLQQEVLEQRRRLLGMEHPHAITAAANLAATYRRQGRWNEAETLQQEVLEQRRRLLGMEHPDTITAAANLAATYRQQGRWSEAETLEQEVLEQGRRVLGMEHPNTITAAANLAATYRRQGRWNEAETLQQEVLEQRRRLLGMEHPDTITAAANLAATYRQQGRWNEAETLEQEVLEQRRSLLGMEHPDTILAAANLAATYRQQGRWNEAETLQQEVLEQRRRLLGMEHPDTITAAANLAATYRQQGRWNEAETLEQEVLEQRRSLLGMEHPDTILAAANLAATYRQQGRWNEAETLQQEVLEQRRRLLGMEHPDTITAAANLAATYRRQGRSSSALLLLAQAVELSRKVIGKAHPETQNRIRGLVSLYEELGKEEEARETREMLLS